MNPAPVKKTAIATNDSIRTGKDDLSGGDDSESGSQFS
jgi:hypothetical protein